MFILKIGQGVKKWEIPNYDVNDRFGWSTIPKSNYVGYPASLLKVFKKNRSSRYGEAQKLLILEKTFTILP